MRQQITARLPIAANQWYQATRVNSSGSTSTESRARATSAWPQSQLPTATWISMVASVRKASQSPK
jgi:hypothetical protein